MGSATGRTEPGPRRSWWRRALVHLARIRYRLLLVNAVVVGVPLGGVAFARMYERELKKREAQALADNAAKTDIGWGHQIRSYVLQPYQMVKDLRTGVTTSNTAAVLNGDLDQFMEATLAQKAFGTGPDKVEDVE